MNTQRRDPFAEVDAPVTFAVKPRASTPPAPEHIEQLARENNFPSRQAPRTPSAPASPAAAVPRKRRVRRTGRNQQFNVKASAETIARFNDLADRKNVTLGELLELALDALQRSDTVA